MRLVRGVSALLMLLIPRLVMAQTAVDPTLPLQMRVTAAAVFDDNVFWTPVRVSDFIWRVTPEIIAQHRSTKLTVLSSYILDAERFQEFIDLSSPAARQRAVLDVTMRPNSVTTLALTGGYGRTSNAGELNLATGLLAQRQKAQEWWAGMNLRRAVGARTDLLLGFRHTDQSIVDAAKIQTNGADVALNRRVGARDDVSFRFAARQYTFDAVEEVPSGIATAAWNRRVSEAVSVGVEGGPQVTRGSVRPEFAANVSHRRGNRTMAISFALTQATAVGVVEVISLRRFQVELASRPRPGREAVVQGAFVLNKVGASVAKVFQVTATITRPIRNHLAIGVDYLWVLQHGDLDVVPQPDLRIRRNQLSVRLIAFSGTSR